MLKPMLTSFGVLVGLAVWAPAALAGDEAQPTEKRSPLVVHEWGTFTTIAGERGGSLDWRPLSGATDLPGFVYTHTKQREGVRFAGRSCRRSKKETVARVRMETPVIYFYTPESREVSVKVGFPQGTITEWYPRARSVGKDGIDWGKLRLLPNTRVSFPREKGENHYYPARETDAVPVRVCSDHPRYQFEKFLFYRGVGNFELPISVRLEGGQVRVHNNGANAISQVILFERRAGVIRYRIHCGLEGGDVVRLARGGRTWDGAHGIQRDLVKVLTTQGLYEREALAMVKTWQDHWFEDGLRVFYVVPREETDRILPLTITPRPDALVRVLVGRVEVLSPERRQRIRRSALLLDSPSPERRRAAERELATFGRFAQPVLEQVLRETESEPLRERLRALIRG